MTFFLHGEKMSSKISGLALDDLQEILFFLIAKRCLVRDEDFCPISLNTLRKQLTLYALDFFNRRSIAQAIARIRDAGLIKARDPDDGFAGTRLAFSTLLFEITPLGLDYIDRLLLAEIDPLYSEAYLP